jgi:hypothetical protein
MKKHGMGRAVLASLCAAAALAACGGGDGGDDTSTQTTAAYTSSLPQAGSSATLLSASFQDTFAPGYLDAGTTKSQLVADMTQDAAAINAGSEFSGFPAGALSDVSISDCNSAKVCTLTGTLTNNDAETTTVPFSTFVLMDARGVHVLGDQKNS